MKALKERILREGEVLPGNILKVTGFLNHQLDIAFIDSIGREIAARFKGQPVTRILTIEASGIAVAAAAARAFGAESGGIVPPVVIAKKSRGGNLAGDVFAVPVHSYTQDRDYSVMVSKKFLSKNDAVLLVDDFLAAGCALEGLVAVCAQAGASVIGAAVVIEKGFQDGGAKLRKEGLRIESLAVIKSMSVSTGVVFA
jgi:xanthine phosphoribosyltransferase